MSDLEDREARLKLRRTNAENRIAALTRRFEKESADPEGALERELNRLRQEVKRIQEETEKLEAEMLACRFKKN